MEAAPGIGEEINRACTEKRTHIAAHLIIVLYDLGARSDVNNDGRSFVPTDVSEREQEVFLESPRKRQRT